MKDITRLSDNLLILFFGDHIELLKYVEEDEKYLKIRKFKSLPEVNYWINSVESGAFYFRPKYNWRINGGNGRTFTLNQKEEVIELFDQLREYGKWIKQIKLKESEIENHRG